PSSKPTITSCPIRGTLIIPHCRPAQLVATRTQHELFESSLPSRSQWNCTFTRLYLSEKISSPGGPTTTAVCVPWTVGRGVTRAGRNGRALGRQEKLLAYSICWTCPERKSPLREAWWLTRVSTYSPSALQWLASVNLWPLAIWAQPLCPSMAR